MQIAPCWLFFASLVLIASAIPEAAFAQATNRDNFTHFIYPRNAPLNVKRVSVKTGDGVTIQDITYTGSKGGTVPAYLVIPKGNGKFAGIIWGHWMMPGTANSNRSEFLDEATALAHTGVVSLLIDAPPNRPGFRPPAGPDTVAQQVVDLRRGMDLLLSRSDVDAARIAYVGHSFDSNIGSILDATDKRFLAFVFMSGPQNLDRQVSWTNPRSYANKLGPASALFQYGLHDELIPSAHAKEYLAMASGPKTVRFYDAGHALNAGARMDRDVFLKEALKLIH